MPFIDCKISKKLTEEQKEEIKSGLGRAVSLLRKPESYLMVGICDGYDLWFAGRKAESGAFVSVSVFGNVNSAESEKMTAAVCDLLCSSAGLDSSQIYVTYSGIKDWGFNGGNF